MSFGPGFNVLLGANSSGKTTVLEAIRLLNIEQIPHRSLENIVEIDTPWIEAPSIVTRLEIPLDQLKKLIGGDQFIIPLGDSASNRIASNRDLEQYWEKNPLSLEFKNRNGNIVEFCTYAMGTQSAKRQMNREWPTLRGTVSASGIDYPEGRSTIAVTDSFTDVLKIASTLNNRIYRFSAERVVRAMSGPGSYGLAPDASNLPFCVNHLRASDDFAFNLLNSYLHRIFPSVHSVSSVPTASGHFELKVHTIPSEKRRSDLAITMDRVGTGVSNALAMLYVVLTARTPQIILLEEPNSYLHPRALRELLAILAEAGSQHQFFVTTHSSDVLRSVPASTVTLLENDGIQTRIQQTMQRDLNSFKAGLLDLGIRLTDLHGCDRVLWVEGETEEAVFPKLLAHFFPELAQGIATLRLHATGDFESRKIRPGKVAEIYRRLSSATFLAPPMVAITLDREGKQQSQIDAMLRECEGMVYLLPRPMVEDYFLVPDAILSTVLLEFGVNSSITDVEQALSLALHASENRLLPQHPTDKTPHAAKVLQMLVSQLGGPGANYDKAKHGPLLTQWILENKPAHFDELATWFGKFIKH